MYLSSNHTEPVNKFFEISTSGNNTIVPLFVSAIGETLGATHIHQIEVSPEGTVTITVKAYNTQTATYRTIDKQLVVAGEGWVFENTTPENGYWERLNRYEELVVELSAAVTCTGFTKVSYVLG